MVLMGYEEIRTVCYLCQITILYFKNPNIHILKTVPLTRDLGLLFRFM